ncbi:hypothetical protein HZH68_010554 [Vespula germanica]|uniref:Uncharacterized protein n=1 Tax=Vespula germanica TaxID=30212 RepID=A0A834N205_VESGE|nr:hypothetical protein HZH68_010554 [Vespula germanica]
MLDRISSEDTPLFLNDVPSERCHINSKSTDTMLFSRVEAITAAVRVVSAAAAAAAAATATAAAAVAVAVVAAQCLLSQNAELATRKELRVALV